MPALVKHLMRESLRLVPTPVYYTLTGGLARVRRTLKLYPERVRVDGAPPLMDHFFDKEEIFKSSADNYEKFVSPYTSEFNWSLGRLYNGFFEAGDPELYYSMVRTHKPDLVIEVGSGHSSYFCLDALKKNGKGRLICIDPEPLRPPPNGAEHIQKRVQDVDLKLFEELGPGDILFIDSSHTTEETQYHVESMLPILREGVITHHHDVTYPYAIYYHDNRELFGEPDLLLDYYWNHQEEYEVLISTSYIRYADPQRWSELVPSYVWNPTRSPGSLWAQRRISGQA